MCVGEKSAAEGDELLVSIYGKRGGKRRKNSPSKEALEAQVAAGEATMREQELVNIERTATLALKEKAAKAAGVVRKVAVQEVISTKKALNLAADDAATTKQSASKIRRRLHATFRQLKRAVRAVAYSEINSRRTALSKLLMMSQTTSAIDQVLGEYGTMALRRVNEALVRYEAYATRDDAAVEAVNIYVSHSIL
jgi:hypothetical protein